MMNSATQLLQSYIEGPHDAASVLSLFAEDGVLEAPYFATFGMPWQFKGHAALAATFGHLPHIYPDLRFENLRITCESDHVAVGEYEFIATSAKTGRRVHQLSNITVVEKRGRISLLREFQNIAEIALALFADGLAGVDIPVDRALRIGAYSGQS
ncbi:hypothetical protein C3731_02740 [Brucella oryzae]|uniref:SnoaL-like domain-containing protein n=2 Tax=Brucella oryzae TaxID=335286 RepID=A0A2S7J4I4_9HYPH|nr:hypothetical protein C3731_02740 [Brucella oryzae]